MGEGPAGRKGLSQPWGLTPCLADRDKGGTVERSWGASGTPALEWKRSHAPGLSIAHFSAFKKWKKVSLGNCTVYTWWVL